MSGSNGTNKTPNSAAQTVEQQQTSAANPNVQTPAQQIAGVAANEDPASRPRSRHQQGVDAILARRQERLEEELVTSNDIMAASPLPPPTDDEELSDEQRAAVVARASQQSARNRAALPTVDPRTLNRTQSQAQAAIPANNQQSEQKIEVPINGRMVALTNKEITDLINIGADAVTQQQRQAAQPLQQQPRPQTPTQPQQQQRMPPPTINTASAKRLVHQLAYGNEDEAAIAMQDIIATAVMIGMNEQAKINPQIINAAVQNAAMFIGEQNELRENLSVIEREYPEIAASQLKGTMAAHALHQIRNRNTQTGRQQSNIDCYREACEIVRRELGLQSPIVANQQQQQIATPAVSQSAASSAPRANLVARKQGANQQPVSAGRAGANIAAAVQAQRASTPAEIVAKMREQRGQLPLN